MPNTSWIYFLGATFIDGILDNKHSSINILLVYRDKSYNSLVVLKKKKKTQVKSINSEIHRASKENLGKLLGWDGVWGRVLKVGNAQLWFKVGEKLSRKWSEYVKRMRIWQTSEICF